MSPRICNPVILLIAACLCAGQAAAGEVHVLAAGDLRLEVEVETDRLAAEFGPRFDRTAFVRSAAVDGVERLGPWGLSDEFGLFGDGVLGFEAAGIGEAFTKIGVGRLVRDTPAHYEFARAYPVEALFPVDVATGEGSLTVSQRSAGDGPWQYEYRKTYALNGPGTLVIEYELANTGAVAWSFEHYNHHWFRPADAPVGPGYRVRTGFELPAAPTGLLHEPQALATTRPLAPGAAEYYASDLAKVPAAANHFALEVDAVPVVRYRGSFKPVRFALYADDRGFCPEVFKRATLEPGAAVTWSATYRFLPADSDSTSGRD